MSSPAAAGTYGPQVAEFFAGCLRLPEGERQGQPFIMDDWQREDTNTIYETDDDDALLWKVVVYGIPRGNGKSPLCAGYADHALVSLPGSPKVYCAAAARDQAGLVHGFAINEAKGGPLDDFLEYPRVTEALGPVRSTQNGGILRAVSADGDLQQGLAPAFVAMDELHTFRTGKQVGLYMAMHTALHKRPAARMIIITTAGATKDSLLGELVDDIIERGEMSTSRHGCKIVVRDYEARRLLI
jgi:phage terminase large subunit-like protein